MGIFTDKDKGYKKLVTVFSADKGKEQVFVGFNRSSGEYVSGGELITVAQVATINEYGSEKRKIPERSFMRSAMDEGSDKIKKVTDTVCLKILEGKMDRTQALGILGEFIKTLFKKKIISGPFKKNKPSTIRAKGGKDKPLIDTSQMINSIEWEINKGTK